MATGVIHNLILRPLRLTATTNSVTLLHHTPQLSFSLLNFTRPFSLSTATITATTTTTRLHCTVDETSLPEPSEIKVEEREIIESEEEGKIGIKKIVPVLPKREVPVLSIKEKKELGSFANSLGDKLKSQQIGKSGVTNNIFFAFDETLEKNELLKLKIHRNCPGELEDVIKQVEEGTGSVVVGQIGRTVILYRPSITKLKAEEKKEQNRKIFAQRKQRFQAAAMMRKKSATQGQSRRVPFERRRSEKVPS